MKNVQNILLSKYNSYLSLTDDVDFYQQGKNMPSALAIQTSLEPLGYALSKNLILALSHMSDEQLLNAYKDLNTSLKEAKGGHQVFKPMYPNFPQQVFEADDMELLMNAFIHYTGDWLGVRILPKYQEEARFPLMEEMQPKVIDICSKNKIGEVFSNLISANVALSPSDKEIVKEFFDYLNQNDAQELNSRLVGATINNKENLAFIGSVVLKSNVDFNTTLRDKFSTPTDLLRLLAGYFDQDVSLATNFKVGKMSRPFRKAVLATLEHMFQNTSDSAQFLENMFNNKELWTKVAHALHVGEYAKLFPLASIAFEDLRANKKPVTYGYEVNQAFALQEDDKLLNLFKQRPGVFARSIAQFYHTFEGNATALKNAEDLFDQVAKDVSTPVLTQVHAYFKYFDRNNHRVFLPKGGLSKLFVSDEEKKVIDKSFRDSIVQSCETALIEKFSTLEPLGKVYVDTALKDQNTPFAQRSASKALHTVARGSQFDIGDEKDTLRMFLWWNETEAKDGKTVKNVGRVDIDLSCIFLDKDYKVIRQCSYWDLRDSGDVFAHSGDITSAPKGACEFIDVNLGALQKNYPDVHYVAMCLNSFTQQKYIDLPECYAGWMLREKPQSGEKFDARTVQNKIDVCCESTQMIPAILDAKNRKMIWADMSVSARSMYANNVKTNRNALQDNVKGLVNMIKPNLYDLFELHAKARGELVAVKEDAEKVFSIHEGITPYMFDEIASQFLVEAKPVPTPSKKMKR